MESIYIIEWVDRGSVRKMLVIDERRRGNKHLPRYPQGRLSKELTYELKKITEEICREIHDLKYNKNLSWSAIGDEFNTTASTVRNFYMRRCLKVVNGYE